MSAWANCRYPDGVRAGEIRPSGSRNRLWESVISGSSPRSAARPEPMESAPRPERSPWGRPAAVTESPSLRSSGSRELRSGPLAGRAGVARPGQEDQAELADLHLVAVGEHGGVHRLAVDVGAVEAADVDDDELRPVAPELGVATGHGHVVEEDVAVGVPTGARGVAVEQEARARVRP